MTAYYDIWFRAPCETRPWRLEGEVPETMDEALEAIAQEDWGVAKVLLVEDGEISDVTDHLWEIAYRQFLKDGGDPAGTDVPRFVKDHAPIWCNLGYQGPKREAV